jgi:hypothetical protein
MKQTAVEWLVEQYKKVGGISISMSKQAKEMEKQQIIDAVEWGNRKGYDEHTLTCINDDDARYYNETFKSE